MPCNIHSITLFKDIQFNAVSENACLITWPEQICAQQHRHIIQCQKNLEERLPEQLIDVVPSYNSLMVYYDFMALSLQKLQAEISLILAHLYSADADNSQHPRQSSATPQTENIIEIPVYYGEEVAWDLKSLADQLNLSLAEVISLHTQTTYQAYALGFTPGFCYLGSIDEKLRLPRRATPRYKIPAGAVAIADAQTAVYPNASPGGWHIIGRTPQPMYRIEADHFIPAITVGDQVKFISITLDEFNALETQQKTKASDINDNK